MISMWRALLDRFKTAYLNSGVGGGGGCKREETGGGADGAAERMMSLAQETMQMVFSSAHPTLQHSGPLPPCLVQSYCRISPW